MVLTIMMNGGKYSWFESLAFSERGNSHDLNPFWSIYPSLDVELSSCSNFRRRRELKFRLLSDDWNKPRNYGDTQHWASLTYLRYLSSVPSSWVSSLLGFRIRSLEYALLLCLSGWEIRGFWMVSKSGTFLWYRLTVAHEKGDMIRVDRIGELRLRPLMTVCGLKV
jgi:hypothetical protein